MNSKCFPDLEEVSEIFPRNPFSPTIDITTIPKKVQDELLDLRNDSASREMFMIKSLTQLGPLQYVAVLPKIIEGSVTRHCRLHLPQ